MNVDKYSEYSIEALEDLLDRIDEEIIEKTIEFNNEIDTLKSEKESCEYVIEKRRASNEDKHK